MVVDTKLYDILGVKPEASDRELKKAFQDMARKYHPDKSSDPDATEKFQQVNEAYEILKDPERRRTYDRLGVEGLRGGGGAGLDDIISHLFGAGGGGGGGFFGSSFFGGGGRQRGRPRTSNIEHRATVALEDLYNGKEITLRITRDVLCPACDGTGCTKGKSRKRCTGCDGRGQRVQIVQMGPGMISQQVSTCSQCRGQGEMIDPKDRCKKCEGKCTTEEKKPIVVHIEPGMEDGEIIRFQGAADEAPGADPGDFIVQIKQKPHSFFHRRHEDLLMAKRITLSQALLGGNLVLNHLDGRKLVITIPPGQIIVPGAVKVISNEGMPQRGNTFQKGKLFVHFEIVFPTPPQLTPALKAAFSAALPPQDEAAGIDENSENVAVVSMQDSTRKEFENAKSSRDKRSEAYNTGDGDQEEDGSTIRCQPQ